jgi:hypothetical protein
MEKEEIDERENSTSENEVKNESETVENKHEEFNLPEGKKEIEEELNKNSVISDDNVLFILNLFERFQLKYSIL